MSFAVNTMDISSISTHSMKYQWYSPRKSKYPLYIRNEVRHMNRRFDRLEKSVGSIRKDNKKLKTHNRELKEQVEDISYCRQVR